MRETKMSKLSLISQADLKAAIGNRSVKKMF